MMLLYKVKFTTTGDAPYYVSETELRMLKGDPHLVLIDGEDYGDIFKTEIDPRPLKKGYRVIPEFPDYMVNRQANVRHIATGHSCWLDRVTADNQALITLSKDGKRYTRSAQALRDSAFEGKNDAGEQAPS